MGLVTALGIGAIAAGSALSSSSANKASRRAAETSQANTDANVALSRDIYGQNRQVLNPFMQRGNVAGNQINALLGLGGSQPTAQGGAQPNALSQFQGGPMSSNAPAGGAGAPFGFGDYAEFGRAGFAVPSSPQYGALGSQFGNFQTAPAAQSNVTMPTSEADMMASGQTAQEAANDAFDIFRNSTGYQFRLGEGLDAVNSGYAGAGVLQSGAAMRGITEYGQNFASNEFGNYLNALGNQQAVGAGAASSLAGVGQNFASQVIGSNNLNAQNQMAAQLGRQNVFGNALGAIGGGILGMGG